MNENKLVVCFYEFYGTFILLCVICMSSINKASPVTAVPCTLLYSMYVGVYVADVDLNPSVTIAKVISRRLYRNEKALYFFKIIS